MKRAVFILVVQLISYTSFAQSIDVSTFVESYFMDEEYQIITSTYGDIEVYFALNYRESNRKFPAKGPIFSRGIVFYIEDSSLIPLLYFNNNYIYTGTGEVLFNNAGIATFYAWEVQIYSSGLVMTRFGINGDVADSFSYDWNNEKLIFERYTIDTSQY